MHRFATAAVLVTVLGACGESDDPRAQTNGYIQSANAVQQKYAAPFKRANEAYVAFSKGELAGEKAATDLDASAEQIRSARDELAVLRAPAPARALHSRLVRLFDMNLAFAKETSELARYQPAAEAATQDLPAVNRRLQRTLARSKKASGQTRALKTFVTAIDGMLRDLRALQVPYVLLPSHGDQVRRLRATRELADQLRRALQRQDAKAVARLLLRFRREASERKPRRALARQAIRQYNRRLSTLSDAYADLSREQTRLERSL